jgi:hypothetical protein
MAFAQNRPSPVGPEPSEAPEPVRSLPFIKQYQGKLGDRKSIAMVLIHWGNGELAGWYSTHKNRERQELRGNFTRGDQFELKEYTDGDYSGAFFGSFEGAARIGGLWIDERGKRQQAFSADQFRFSVPAEPWEGTWGFREGESRGRLLIGNVGAESFDYALVVIRQNQLSQITGTVTRRGRRAFFEDPGFGTAPCRLRFDLTDEAVLVTMESNKVVCGFGASVDGRFMPVREGQ